MKYHAVLLAAAVLFAPQAAAAACSSNFARAELPPSVPNPSKYACPSSENAASGQVLVSQEYKFTGITLGDFFKQYRAELEGKGWQIAGVRTVPTMHALLASHPSGLTLELSAREKTTADQMIDRSTFNPRTFDGFPIDANAKEFTGKIVIKGR